jgi:hypothetical protein
LQLQKKFELKRQLLTAQPQSLLVFSLPAVLFPKHFLSCRENSVPVPATSRIKRNVTCKLKTTLMKKSCFIKTVVLFTTIIGCSKKETMQPSIDSHISQNAASVDTIKRNSVIRYYKEMDTIVQKKDHFEVSITTEKIDEKFVIQYFRFDDKKVIANYYPDKSSTVKIKKNGNLFFDQIFHKSSFKDYVDQDVEKFVLHDIIINAIPEMPNDTLSLKATLEAPNTDWNYDFLIKVFPNGQSKIISIESESE